VKLEERDPKRIVDPGNVAWNTSVSSSMLLDPCADVEFTARIADRSREHPTEDSEERRTRRGEDTFAEVEERSARNEAGSRRD